MFLIDTHCHLNMLENEKKVNIKDAIERANSNNVKIINNIATKVSEFDLVYQTALKYENVYATIGVHPEEIKIGIPSLNTLIEWGKKEKVIAVGETGYEYHYSSDNKINQKKNFEIHIEASRQLKIPLVIHTRDADIDTIDILKSEMKNGEFSFILHCFSSGKELCWTALDLGGYISLSGIITFKKSDELRKIIQSVPLNRIFLETDAPFLAPEPYRGKINEPTYIKVIFDYLLDFLKIDSNIFTDTMLNNFFNLFNKVKRKK